MMANKQSKLKGGGASSAYALLTYSIRGIQDVVRMQMLTAATLLMMHSVRVLCACESICAHARR